MVFRRQQVHLPNERKSGGMPFNGEEKNTSTGKYWLVKESATLNKQA